MRKAQKQNLLDCITSLQQAHDEIRQVLRKKDTSRAQNMLAECQNFAISLGETIEKTEGEGFITVGFLEEYCELCYRQHEELGSGVFSESALYKSLQKQLYKIEKSVKDDIPVKKEIAFFPYKASMWDSLESIYLAAKADENCNAYCVPIPYYDRKPDLGLGTMHYEGFDFPKGIEVTDWQTYRFEERKPDAAFICYPYDDANYVTTVHPRFYSRNLKPHTGCLVYVPYYSTIGGMSEMQKSLPAYYSADYIVTQAPLFRDYFDRRIPDRKFLPYGSPKFDKIIHKCQNPPELPTAWKAKMDGKKVFFYNTSLGGMLAHTESFLKKMEYVFSCFEKRGDVCILWRPHPLLESTFASMRPWFLPEFHRIRDAYIQKDFGIYDTTGDMTDAIAYSDAYIGDDASSVLSLFGIVGKPIFVLNNEIHEPPAEESWRGTILPGFNLWEQDRFAITQGNKLYVSEPYRHDYRYACELSDRYTGGWYYSMVLEIGGKLYACPGNAQKILEIGKQTDGTCRIEKEIPLEPRAGNENVAFCGAVKYDRFLVLLPFRYPAIVRYDTQTGEIRYFAEHHDVYARQDENNAFLPYGFWPDNGKLYLASPVENAVCILDIMSGTMRLKKLPTKSNCGCIYMRKQGDAFWMMPYEGYTVTRWNPETDELREYTVRSDGFQCVCPGIGYTCDRKPFQNFQEYNGTLFLAPWWGSQYVKLDIETGVVSEWKLPYEESEPEGYYYIDAKSVFVEREADADGWTSIFSWPKRKLWRVNLGTNACEELPITFDKEELRAHAPGFGDQSQWHKYSCSEDAFFSLPDFLDGKTVGTPHDAEKQRASYGAIAANNDGTCGEKVYAFVRSVC